MIRLSEGLPIVILMLIGLIVLSVYVLRKATRAQTRPQQSKKVYRKLGLYGLTLVVFYVIHFFIPFQSSSGEGEMVTIDFLHVHEMVQEGKWEASMEEFLVYEEAFTLTDPGQELFIQSVISDHHNFDVLMLVEEMEMEEERVEARLYHTPSSFDGVDVTEALQPYEIEMHTNTLVIKATRDQLHVASFQHEFPFKQFQKEPKQLFSEEGITGEQIVYLRVPQGLKIVTDDEWTDLYYIQD